MIKDAMTSIGKAAREFVRNRSALIIFNGLFALLLAVLYLFVWTKEATAVQIIFTALLAIAAPVLFFMIQAAGVYYTRGVGAGPGALLRQSLRGFWKLLLISLPLVLLAVLSVYLLNKVQAQYQIAGGEAARPVLAPSYPPAAPPPAPVRWSDVVFSSLRLLLLGVVLPLAAIHLWIAAAHEGFAATLKKSLRILARAFSARSILIYTIGFIGFGLMPYFLIFTRTPVSNAWAEIILLGIRLGLTFVFMLWGWIITLGALTKMIYEVPVTANPEATAGMLQGQDIQAQQS